MALQPWLPWKAISRTRETYIMCVLLTSVLPHLKVFLWLASKRNCLPTTSVAELQKNSSQKLFLGSIVAHKFLYSTPFCCIYSGNFYAFAQNQIFLTKIFWTDAIIHSKQFLLPPCYLFSSENRKNTLWSYKCTPERIFGHASASLSAHLYSVKIPFRCSTAPQTAFTA